MQILIIRGAWLFALFLALLTGHDRRHRGWAAYLMGSFLVGIIYWPDLWPLGFDDWYARFWWCLVPVLGLRIWSVLEALHLQTERFRWWSPMMLGLFLLVSAVVLGLVAWRHSMGISQIVPEFPRLSHRDQFLQARRYFQAWVGLLGLLGQVYYWSVGSGNNWKELELKRSGIVSTHRNSNNTHALIVSMLAISYGVVGLMDMAPRSPEFVAWEVSLSFAVDAVLYLVWAGWSICRAWKSVAISHRTGLVSLRVDLAGGQAPRLQ